MVHFKLFERFNGNRFGKSNSKISENKKDRMHMEIKEDGMQRVVDIKDIFYIEKRRNYSYIYLKDRRCVKVRKNLRDYEFELAGKGLVRVHAGYMVAMKYCAKIEKGQIVMEDGTEIPISRDRKNMVKSSL